MDLITKREDSCQANLERFKTWFSSYVKGFLGDPSMRENVALKIAHTRRVCDLIVDIGHSLGLMEEDLCLAELSALFHDIGRFEQIKRYGTFSDSRSVDHGSFGARFLRESNILHGLEMGKADMITRITEYHNKATIPPGEDEHCIFFLKMVRDADKVDIYRVVTEYYARQTGRRNRAVELDLPDLPEVSYQVCQALGESRIVQMNHVKTLNDFKLLQIGWIYDINFRRTFELIREKRYLEKIWDSLPKASISIVNREENDSSPLVKKVPTQRSLSDMGLQDFSLERLFEMAYGHLLQGCKKVDVP